MSLMSDHSLWNQQSCDLDLSLRKESRSTSIVNFVIIGLFYTMKLNGTKWSVYQHGMKYSTLCYRCNVSSNSLCHWTHNQRQTINKAVAGWRFKIFYERINRNTLKFLHLNKTLIFNVWVRYFQWNFKWCLCISTHNILPTHWKQRWYIDGLEQDCSISIAKALEILQSCTKLSM